MNAFLFCDVAVPLLRIRALATALLFIAASCNPLTQLSAANASSVALAPVAEWELQKLEPATKEGVARFKLPLNYVVGRAMSPQIEAKPSELFTFAAEVETRFVPTQQSFYRFWLEIEFLQGKTILRTVASPELIGSQPKQLLAITASAPEGATKLRLAVCAQNKFWNPLENEASVSEVRLLRLNGKVGGAVVIGSTEGIGNEAGPRKATLFAKGTWPDGAALAVTTNRGASAPVVLMEDGRAEIAVRYAPEDVGAALVTATVMDHAATFRVSDPLAATVEIRSVLADTLETPALVQMVRDGKMIPGRYQASMPGIFMTAPWSIDVAPGQWQLRVRRGPEFRAFERTLDVKSGETATLDKVELERQVDPRLSGWYGGDADGDVYHGERIYTDVSPQTAAEISQAMGLDWAGVGSWGSPSPKTWREAHAFMRGLSRPNFLFLWTDERPKSGNGHACFVGLDRPDDDAFGWGWTRAVKPLANYEALKLNRDSGAATFANHPVRWWMSGAKFRTNMYASLPFDLCAAGLLDGYNINEKPNDVHVWSLLLDHGYRVAATTGADFGLDRPIGPVPGKSRMYCYCPNGVSGEALAEAVRRGNTVVSTGPVLMADIKGQPPGSTLKTGQAYNIKARAWARGDEPDWLQRIELWAHGKAIASKSFEGQSTQAEHSFSWEPHGNWDWAAVRLVTKQGWAMTSAFYASGPDWRPPQQPVQCEVTLAVSGLDAAAEEASLVEIWDGLPGLATSRKVIEHPLTKAATFKAPVSGTIVVRTADGRRKIVSLYDAIGMHDQLERIAAGAERERPLLEWKTYEDVLKRCQSTKIEVSF